MHLSQLVSYLDDYLRVREVPDYPEALNGLQVENAGEVTRVGAAVDLCEATVQLAATEGVDLLLVHHGLFWGGLRPLVGPRQRRVAGIVRHNIAVYSAHLPLDRHPDVGNNAVLARALGVVLRGEFGKHPVVQRVEFILGEVTARHAGLIGEEEHEISGLVEPADRLRRVRHPADPLPRAHIAVVVIDDAVAVEESGGPRR